jgi:hypothetical protein
VLNLNNKKKRAGRKQFSDKEKEMNPTTSNKIRTQNKKQ